MIKKEANRYVPRARYTLEKSTFSFWIQMHQRLGYDIKKISGEEIILKKKGQDMYYLCKKHVA